MNKYVISYVERKMIEVTANSEEEAEVKAFESDAWSVFVEDLHVTLMQTDDPSSILKAFERDQQALEELQKGLNGTQATDFDRQDPPDPREYITAASIRS
jgi:hypothetical protein